MDTLLKISCTRHGEYRWTVSRKGKERRKWEESKESKEVNFSTIFADGVALCRVDNDDRSESLTSSNVVADRMKLFPHTIREDKKTCLQNLEMHVNDIISVALKNESNVVVISRQ